jgi:hypothetical protein
MDNREERESGVPSDWMLPLYWVCCPDVTLHQEPWRQVMVADWLPLVGSVMWVPGSPNKGPGLC